MNENKIKQNIKNIAYTAKYLSNKILTFKDLEYDFDMTKEEIINIMDVFGKAKLFYYKITSLESSGVDENYDFGSVKRRQEFNTGRFKLFFNVETPKIVSLENKLNIPTRFLPDGMTHSKIEAEIKKLEKQRNDFNNSKAGERHRKLAQETLDGILKSQEVLNSFIKKYNKYINIPMPSSEFEKNIGKLKINTKTGNFTYYNKKGIFPPKDNPYKLLMILINSNDYQMSYDEIFEKLYSYLSKDKSNRDKLYDLIRKINNILGVLPKNKKSNPEFIKNIKRFGYKLIIE